MTDSADPSQTLAQEMQFVLPRQQVIARQLSLPSFPHPMDF
jgi:hypothetical protein